MLTSQDNQKIRDESILSVTVHLHNGNIICLNLQTPLPNFHMHVNAVTSCWIKNGFRHSMVYLLFWHWAPAAAAGHRQLKLPKLLDMQIPPFRHVLPNELRASSQLQAVWGAAAVHINSKSPGRCWVQEPCSKLRNAFTINIGVCQWETEAQYKIIEIIAVTDYKILNWDDTQTTDQNPVLCYNITRREPKSVWWWRTG